MLMDDFGCAYQASLIQTRPSSVIRGSTGFD
jgi:hypothetical protein